MKEIRPNRFGQFVFIAGLLLMVVFFATDQQRNPQFCLFGLGMSALALGGYIIWRTRTPGAHAERFRTIRRMAKNFSEWSSRRRAAATLKKKK